MAKLTLNFTDDIKFARDLNASAKFYGYSDTITDIEGVVAPNPQTKQDFVEQIYKRMFKEASKTQRTADALATINIEE